MALDYRYIFLPEQDFFWATYTGDVTLRDLTRAHEDFKAHPSYASNLDELLDFSRCSFDTLSTKQVEIMRLYLLDQPARDNSKSSIIVGTELEFGLARMLSAIISDVAPVTRGVFYTPEDALAWMRPDQADEITAAYQAAVDQS